MVTRVVSNMMAITMMIARAIVILHIVVVLTGIAKQMACSGLWRDWPTIGQAAKCQVRAQNCPAHCIYTLKKINCRDCRHDDLPSPCNPLLCPTAFALATAFSPRHYSKLTGECDHWDDCGHMPTATTA